MRFMMIVKHSENQGPPPKQLMDAITKLTEETVKDGHDSRERGAWADCAGYPRAAFQGANQGGRRAFHRGQGGYRRLCAIRVEIEGRGDRISHELHGASQETLAGLGRGDGGSSDAWGREDCGPKASEAGRGSAGAEARLLGENVARSVRGLRRGIKDDVIGSGGGHRDTSHNRRGLEDRVAQAHCRPDADRARCRPRRGSCTGCSGRRAGAMAGVRRPG